MTKAIALVLASQLTLSSQLRVLHAEDLRDTASDSAVSRNPWLAGLTSVPYVETVMSKARESGNYTPVFLAWFAQEEYRRFSSQFGASGPDAKSMQEFSDRTADKINSLLKSQAEMKASIASSGRATPLSSNEELKLFVSALKMGGDSTAQATAFIEFFMQAGDYAVGASGIQDKERNNDSTSQFTLDMVLDMAGPKALERYWQMVAENPSLAVAFDPAFHSHFGLPPTLSDAEMFYDHHPTLRSQKGLESLSGQLANIQREQKAQGRTLEQIRKEMQILRDRIEKARDELIKRLEAQGGTLDAILKELEILDKERKEGQISSAEYAIKKAELESRKKAVVDSRLSELAEFQAIGRIFSGLGSIFHDSDIGRALNHTGQVMNVFASVGRSITLYQAMTPGMTAAVLTGDILAGINVLVNLYSGGTSPEVSMLQALQEQVESFRKEMNGRFDRLDSQVEKSLLLSSQILEMLQENHSEAKRLILQHNERVSEKIRILDGKLETGILDLLFNDATDARFRCFEWEQSYTTSQMTAEEFEKNCILPLSRFGLITSTLPSVSLGSNRSLAPVDWAAELAKPIDRNADYLATLLEHSLKIEGIRPVPNKVIPHLGVFGFSADQVADLILAFPEYAKQKLKPTLVDELIRKAKVEVGGFHERLFERLPFVIDSLAGMQSRIIHGEVESGVQSHHRQWRIRSRLLAPGAGADIPVFFDQSEGVQKSVQNMRVYTPSPITGTYPEVRSCNSKKTWDQDRPLPQALNHLLHPSQLRGAKFARDLGFGDFSACYTDLELVDASVEKHHVGGGGRGESHDWYSLKAKIVFDYVISVGDVELFRKQIKSKEFNADAGDSRPVLSQKREKKIWIAKFFEEYSKKAKVSDSTWKSIATDANSALSSFPHAQLEAMLRTKLAELRKNYLLNLAQDLANPVAAGVPEFVTIRSQFEGIKAAADTAFTFVYPEAVRAAGGVDNLILGDLMTFSDSLEVTQQKLQHAMVYESFLTNFSIAIQIKDDLDRSDSDFASRPQILPGFKMENRHSKYARDHRYYFPSDHLLQTITKLEAARKVFDSGN